MSIRNLLGALTVISTFAYCTPKLSKEITKSSEPSSHTNSSNITINRSAQEFEKGKLLMNQSCAGCHVLFDPKDYSVVEWEKILEKMIPKARLANEDAELVRDYIIAHSNDYNQK